MELPELMSRLEPFCAHCYGTENLRVFDLVKMPGHAGFAYGFRIEVNNKIDSWFLRLPPPNVNWKGTADVLRQVEVLNALDKPMYLIAQLNGQERIYNGLEVLFLWFLG